MLDKKGEGVYEEMNNTVAIVVTYNRKELLEQCIKRLEKQTYPVDILVVDNASNDGTCELFKNEYNDVTYINTGENLGGAGGFQYGIKEAYSRGYKYFWLMDDDTLPYSNAHEELMKADKELEKYGFLSSVAEWTDGSLCKMNIQRTGICKKKLNYEKVYNKIIMATFVSFFIRREIVEKVGLPIKEFVIWSDDLEYSRRISKLYPCYLITRSRVVHKMQNNNKVGIESETSNRMWRYELMYRNEVYVYRREGIRGWIFLWMRIILHTARVVLNAKNDKKQKILIIWKSFFAGFRFKPSIERV